MGDEYIVKGNILNYDSIPQKNIFVEAYHVLGFPYYLGYSKLDSTGKFEITFPKNPYGYTIFYNIKLKINDSHQILFETKTKRLIPHLHDKIMFEDLEIPSNSIYSDQISHTSWPDLIKNGIEDITHLPTAEIQEKVAEFLVPIENAKYILESEQRKLNYRGVNVPKTPKKENHKHTIPWYPNWP